MASGPAPRRPAIDRALARVTRPTDVAALVAFRVAVGLIVTVSATRFLAYGWVDELFYKPTFFFKYWGLSWVRPLPAPLMHVAFVALAALGLCVAAGLFYRAAAALVCALVLWVQLIDVTNYLNHYYLLGLLTGLMALMPLGRAVSLDAWRRPDTRVSHFPVWCTYLLRVQVAVVYVHAGLAKATPDWLLHAQPLNIWLSARTDTPLVGALFDERAMAYAMSWGGFFFDTTIALFLAWRRTRVFAYVVVLAFHATVGRLFPIGMFPWIMIAAVLVFFEPTWPRDVIAKLRALRARSGVRQVFCARAPSRVEVSIHPSASFGLAPRLAFALASAFCLLQALAPLRCHLYGGNVLWHEQGMRWSWRVMAREKNGSITYWVDSPQTGRSWAVSPRPYLTDRQLRELNNQPDLVLQLAHHIGEEFRAKGHGDVRVRVDALVSLNGRAAAPMIDPRVDLLRVRDGLGKASWILPAPSGPPIHLRPLWASGSASRRSSS